MNEKYLEKIMRAAEEACMCFGGMYLMLPLDYNKATQIVWFSIFFTVFLLKRIFRTRNINKQNRSI